MVSHKLCLQIYKFPDKQVHSCLRPRNLVPASSSRNIIGYIDERYIDVNPVCELSDSIIPELPGLAKIRAQSSKVGVRGPPLAIVVRLPELDPVLADCVDGTVVRGALPRARAAHVRGEVPVVIVRVEADTRERRIHVVRVGFTRAAHSVRSTVVGIYAGGRRWCRSCSCWLR